MSVSVCGVWVGVGFAVCGGCVYLSVRLCVVVCGVCVYTNTFIHTYR